MPSKNRWNISKQKGEELIHKHLIDTLYQSNNKMKLKDLLVSLNKQTEHVTLIHRSTLKPLSAYIQSMYGTFTSFLDRHSMYGLLIENKVMYVLLFDDNIKDQQLLTTDIQEIREWLVVHDDEFVIV